MRKLLIAMFILIAIAGISYAQTNNVDLVKNGKLKDYPSMTIAEAIEPYFNNAAWQASGNNVIFTGEIKESYYSIVANSANFRDAPVSVHQAVVSKYRPIFVKEELSNTELTDFIETWKNESSQFVIAKDMLNYYASKYCTRGTAIKIVFSENSSGAVSIAEFDCPNCMYPGQDAFLNMFYYPFDYDKNILSH